MNRLGNDALPTINDVARHAGVSRATTSRVLGEYGAVSASAREKVLSSSAALGYRPNVIARAMRAGSTKTLGLVIAEIGLSVFDLAMRSVIDSARRHGYEVLVANTNEDLRAERESIRVMLEKQVDGLIVVPSAVDDVHFLGADELKGRPVTLLDRTLDSLSLPSVTADNRAGARAAVDHLTGRGHSRIGLIVVTSNITGETGQRPAGLVSTIHDRIEGYQQGMLAAGFEPEPALTRYCGDAAESALTAVRTILDAADPPTALLASNANMSLAVLRVAKERGLAIGRDLSLIGFDDAPWATVLTPSLTVVDVPIEEMAETAVHNLIAQINAPEQSHPSTVLPMALLSRDSVADLRSPSVRGDNRVAHSFQQEPRP